jgi:hypothetical protein
VALPEELRAAVPVAALAEFRAVVSEVFRGVEFPEVEEVVVQAAARAVVPVAALAEFRAVVSEVFRGVAVHRFPSLLFRRSYHFASQWRIQLHCRSRYRQTRHAPQRASRR